MRNFEQVESILKSLEDPKRSISRLFEKLIKHIINYLNILEEIKEEISELNEIYQIEILDQEINFWIELKNQHISYGHGKHPNPDLSVSIDEETIRKIYDSTITISEAYMKGVIKLKGDLSYAIRARNLINYSVKLIKELLRKK
ncbi:MAG: SCP2 sterol-binding domain-containing protein [Promethearchaeia archaeon]